MGPQHVRCGMLDGLARAERKGVPSMGPQHVRCGMVMPGRGAAAAQYLQWGRNMFVAECSYT